MSINVRNAGEAQSLRAAAVRQRGDRPSQRRSSAETAGRPLVRAGLSRVEVRAAAATDNLTFDGHASVTERGYEMWDWYGPYTEVIATDAFSQTLARGDLDVPLVLAHDQMRRIARTTNGSLRLSMDDEGLLVEADLDPMDQDVAYIVPKLRAGLIDEMSFAFRIEAGQWSPDFSEYRIERVEIHRGDVAIVGYGANPFTDSGVRGSTQDTSTRARALLALALAR